MITGQQRFGRSMLDSDARPSGTERARGSRPVADHNFFANLIWQIADLLRGPYRPPQYERVMLPMTVLRRFDCVLAPTKTKVLTEHERLKDRLTGEALDVRLNTAADQRFHNHSQLDFEKLKGDPDQIAHHLADYIKGFSANIRRIFEYFEFENEIERMREANILYLVVSKFCDVDLHPEWVPNEQMGLISRTSFAVSTSSRTKLLATISRHAK